MDCHFCDDKECDRVCKSCFNKMEYKTDAIKKYGVNEAQLETIFSISYDNRYYRNTVHKYHPDDLEKLQEHLINTLPDNNRQKKKIQDIRILFKKQNIELKERVEKIAKIKDFINVAMNKLDPVHVKYHEEHITNLIDDQIYELYDQTGSIVNIALYICDQIGKFINIEKEKTLRQIKIQERQDQLYKLLETKYSKYEGYIDGDPFINLKIDLEQLEKNIKGIIKREHDVMKQIDLKITCKKYNKFARELDTVKRFICCNSDNSLDDIIVIVNSEVDCKRKADTRLVRQNKIYNLRSKYDGKYQKYLTKLYDDYINGNITFKQLTSNIDKVIDRYDKINEHIDKDVEKQYCGIAKQCKIVDDYIVVGGKINMVMKELIKYLDTMITQINTRPVRAQGN